MTLSPTTRLMADAALPQRDALLDVRIVADRIGRRMGVGSPVAVTRCDRLRVNYQIGKSLRVLHRVDVGGARWTIAARAFRDGRGERAYEEVRDMAVPCGAVHPVFYDAGLDTVFWVFPNDRKIAGLAAAASGEFADNSGPSGRWHSTRLVAYAPEKSATLACLDESGAIIAYAKVMAHNQAEHDYARYRTLCNAIDGNPWLRLPLTLAYLPQYRLLLIEAITGRRMHDPAAGEIAVQDAGRLGQRSPPSMRSSQSIRPHSRVLPVFGSPRLAGCSEGYTLTSSLQSMPSCASCSGACQTTPSRPSAFTATCIRKTRSSPLAASRSSTSRISPSGLQRPTSGAFWLLSTIFGVADGSPATRTPQ